MAKDMTVPPVWCKNAVATSRGWEDPQTGELYVSNKHLQLDKSKTPKLSTKTSSKASKNTKTSKSVDNKPKQPVKKPTVKRKQTTKKKPTVKK